MDMIDATHTRWSAPGSQQNRLLELPPSPIGLADVLSNFLLIYGAELLSLLPPKRTAISARPKSSLKLPLSGIPVV
jgi:hypothetical protein